MHLILNDVLQERGLIKPIPITSCTNNHFILYEMNSVFYDSDCGMQ